MRILIVCMFLFGIIAGQDSMFVDLDTLVIGANSAENREGQFVLDIKPKESYFSKSLAEQLRRQSSIDTKTYGPAGTVSSVTLRGMSSSHTVFNWNGFNINSLTLGSYDFGRESMPLNGRMSINMSPASSNYGSGTVGGVIAYQSNLNFNQGHSLSYANSFGMNDYRYLKRDSIVPNQNHQFVYQFSNKKYSLQTGVLLTDAPNYYVSDSIILNRDESFQRITAQAELYRKLKKGKVGISYWGGLSNKDLRPSATIPNQQDTNHRVVAKLDWQGDKYFFKAMFGYFSDASLYKSEYLNGMTAVDSYIATKSYRGKLSYACVMKKGRLLSLTGLFRDDIAQVQNYGGEIRENQANLIARYNFEWKGFKVLPVLRFEYYENFKEQVVKSISLLKKHKNLKLRLNLEDKFRIPTLNDRYWQNSGVIDLNPEKGYGSDLNASWYKDFDKSCWLINVSLYHIVLDNWIQWVPGEGAFWSPVSYQKVWSRGITTDLKYGKTVNNVLVELSSQASFAKSEIIENYQGNDALIGKQLVYTPKYRANANLDLSFKKWKINLGGDYTSRRETTSDNIEVWSLDPVFIVHGQISINKSFKKINLTSFLNVENVLNKDFVWVRGFPMPGRFTQLGIKINFKTKEK